MQMYRIIWIIVIFNIWTQANAQTAFLSPPIEGIYGNDFIFVNYVDWSFDSIQDYHCGSKTYDGHQGTDMVIKGFQEMDAGVSVIAAASGVVTYIKDGLFDHETAGDTSKHFGNFICIKHPNLFYSYYAHLKSGSILVHVGDSVNTGQKIAEVGSSGDATDPHLHFELWYDSLYLVDPFGGNCGNPDSKWLNEIKYDTSFAIWKSGITPVLPNLNDLRFGVINKLQFDYQNDPYISYWNLQYGIKKGDITTIKWYNDSSLVYSYDYTYNKDYWFYYFWTYIYPSTTGVCNNCLVEYYLNGTLKSSQPFKVLLETKTKEVSKTLNIAMLNQILVNNPELRYRVFDLSGKQLEGWYLNNNKYPTGIYFVELIDNKGKRSILKLVILN